MSKFSKWSKEKLIINEIKLVKWVKFFFNECKKLKAIISNKIVLLVNQLINLLI